MIGTGEGQAGAALSIRRKSVVQPRKPVLQRGSGRALMVVVQAGAIDQRETRPEFVIGVGPTPVLGTRFWSIGARVTLARLSAVPVGGDMEDRSTALCCGLALLCLVCTHCGGDTAGRSQPKPGGDPPFAGDVDRDDGGDGERRTDGDAGGDADEASPGDEAGPGDGTSVGDAAGYAPPTVVANDACVAPLTLDVGAGPVVVMTRIPAHDDGTEEAVAACGVGAGPAGDGFFSVTLDEPSRLSVTAAGTTPVTVGVLPNQCPVGAALAPCGPNVIADLQSGTYLILLLGDPGADLTLSLAAVPLEPPPAEWPPVVDGGDSCFTPTPLVVTTGPVFLAGSLSGASADLLAAACDDPAVLADRFYMVTVPAAGLLTAAVVGAPTPTLGWIGAGCVVAPTVAPCGLVSTIDVVAGTYVLGVGGDAETTFDLVVTWQAEPPLPGSCAAPIAFPLLNGRASLSVSFVGAPLEQTGSCAAGASYRERAYMFTLDGNSDVIADTVSGWTTLYLRRGPCATGVEVACASNSNQPLAAYDLAAGTYYLVVEDYSSTTAIVDVRVITPPAPAPPNDTCSDAATLSFVNDVAVATGTFVGADPDGAGTTCGGPEHLYYRFTLEAPRQVSVTVSQTATAVQLASGSCGAQVVLGCDSFSPNLCSDVLAPGTYTIRVGEYYNTVSDPFTLTVRRWPPPAAPANDTCANPQPVVLSAGNATVPGSLAGAANDRTFAGSCPVSTLAGQDVLYSFSLNELSDVIVTLGGSGRIYDMTTWLVAGDCATGVTLGCHAGSGANRYPALAPGTYFVGVEWDSQPPTPACGSTTTESFSLQLSATPTPPTPANDSCVSPSVVSLPTVGSLAAVSGTTYGATNDTAQITCPGNSAASTVSGLDVVYSLEVGATGVIRVMPVTAMSGMFIYLVSPCGDDSAWACRSGTSTLSTGFAVPPGTYYLTVDQTSGYGGNFSVYVELAPP